MTTYSKHVLPNGLRIISVPMENAQTVTLMVLVEAGSKYETKEINGISHFLEHMCFKGTEKYSSQKQLAVEFDKIGCEQNAFTGNEFTGYYAKAHHHYFPKILDLVADMYLAPTLPADELEREKGVIIEEINMNLDRPQRIVADTFDELLYGDQPAGWTIIGPKENISRFTRDELVSYRNKHYVAEATVVVIAGKFDEAQVIEDITERFAKISTAKKEQKVVTSEFQQEPGIKVHFKETDQTHLLLGFRSFDMYDERYWASGMLAAILGQGMSSRLWTKMREDLGICYYVSAGNTHYTDVGNFYISAGVGNGRVDEAISGIMEEIRHVLKYGVTEEELGKAKDFRIGNMFLNLETSDAFSDFYGFQELYREEIFSPQDIEKRIRQVTVEDVMNIAKELFVKEKMNLALVGPFKDAAPFYKHFEL